LGHGGFHIFINRRGEGFQKSIHEEGVFIVNLTNATPMMPLMDMVHDLNENGLT
jgi:hypothetical protein